MKRLLRARLRLLAFGSLLLLAIALPFNLFASSSSTTVVHPADIGTSWFINDTRSGASSSIVAAPASPHLGIGSLRFVSDSSIAGPSQAKAQLFNYGYIGTNLSAIDGLSYWAYRSSASTNSAAQTITLNLEVDYLGNGSSFTTLVYEPVYQPGGVAAMLTDTWQKWDAYNGGNATWWSTATIPGACGGCYVTWNTITTNNPSAKIKGGVGYNIGSGWAGQYTGYTDAFAISVATTETVYDFDPIPQCSFDCYVSTSGSNSNGGTSLADAKLTIQAGVNQVSPGGTVHVASGIYHEDVNVTKALTLQGDGAGSTTVSGVSGGDAATIKVGASAVVIDGFTITRDGNAAATWNDPSLNSAGIAVQGQTNSAEIRNNNFVGNRTGIDINNSNGNNIHDNTIDDNRTGLIFRNQTDNTVFVHNTVRNNWTVGILFLDASSGTNVPVQQALSSSFNRNNISGNWYGGAVDRQVGGSIPAPGSNLKDFECNWWGTAFPSVSTANSTEPGYAALIPVAYGGSSVAPGGQPDILGPASANIVYIPRLVSDDLSGACVGDSTNGTKQAVLATLQSLLPSGDAKTDKRIQKAIKSLEKSLTPAWWDGSLALDPKDGKKVFDQEKKVVHELSKKELASNQDAQELIAIIVGVDRALAQYAIDNPGPGATAKDIAKATEEMAKGDSFMTSDPEKAIEHYKKAWEKVVK